MYVKPHVELERTGRGPRNHVVSYREEAMESGVANEPTDQMDVPRLSREKEVLGAVEKKNIEEEKKDTMDTNNDDDGDVVLPVSPGTIQGSRLPSSMTMVTL